MRKSRKIIIILSPILCFLIIWGFSLARCEILTLIHGQEFAELYKENTMLGEQEYWKVLDYSKTNARVYYIAVNHLNANILSFAKQNGQWKYGKWEDTVWSISGSADNTIWPYWWHFFYSHPRL